MRNIVWDLFGFLYRSIRETGFLNRRRFPRRNSMVDDRRWGSKGAEGRRSTDD